MSLLRLLAAGKSLVGIKDANGRYRVTEQRLLPKFASKRNPFRATTRPEEAQSPRQAAAAETGVAEQQPAEEPTSPQAQAWVPPAPSRGPASGNGSRWAGQLVAKLKRLAPKRSSKPVKPAILRFTKPLVQAELSLDSVKVVRNDLTDSDLEIVPAKPPVAPPSSPPAGALPTRRGFPPESPFAKVTGRFFGASKT
jgi:hypothetical protein